jgi:hypothetical protein
MCDDDATELERLFWRARVAQDVLKARGIDPGERAEAARHWAELYHEVYSPRDETAKERVARLAYLESLAATAGIAPLLRSLREFMQDIGHAILSSPDPVRKLDRILHGPSKRGAKNRTLRERIAIAAAVEKLLTNGMTPTKAYKSVASTLGESENFTADAVRIIYKRATKMKNSADASRVRMVAAGVLEF